MESTQKVDGLFDFAEARGAILSRCEGTGFAQNARTPTTVSDLTNAVQVAGGDPEQVKKAIAFLNDKLGRHLTSDELQVAKGLARLNLDRSTASSVERTATVLAALLVRGVVEEKFRAEDLKVEWGENVSLLAGQIAKVLLAPTKINSDDCLSKEQNAYNQLQFGLFQKMMMRMDERVLIFMAADWLQRLRYYDREWNNVSPKERNHWKKVAIDVMGCGLPFFRDLKWECVEEIQKLVVRVIDPKAYRKISASMPDAVTAKGIKARIEKGLRQKVFNKIKKDHPHLFHDIKSEKDLVVVFRIKDHFSFWSKIREKVKKAQNIYKLVLSEDDYNYRTDIADNYAARVIIPDRFKKDGTIDEALNKKRCFTVQKIVESLGIFNDKMRDDYYDGNKRGFRAVHTGIVMAGLLIEVQILTRNMDWLNNNKGFRPTTYKNLAIRLDEQVLQAEGTVKHPAARKTNKEKLVAAYNLGMADFLARLRARITGKPYQGIDYSTIVVSDRDGMLLEMPKGAKCYAFAYLIHSRLPDETSKIVLNGKEYNPFPVEWDMPLQNGDHVIFRKGYLSDILPPKEAGQKVELHESLKSKIEKELKNKLLPRILVHFLSKSIRRRCRDALRCLKPDCEVGGGERRKTIRPAKKPPLAIPEHS